MQGNDSFSLNVFNGSSFLELTAVIHGGPVPIIETEVGKNT